MAMSGTMKARTKALCIHFVPMIPIYDWRTGEETVGLYVIHEWEEYRICALEESDTSEHGSSGVCHQDSST